MLPRFESSIAFSDPEVIISDPEQVINYFEDRGYRFLSDWNSGKFLVPDTEPYIPERILMPSGRIVEEREILDGLDNLPLNSKRRRELEGAFYYFNACFHESTDPDYQRWSGPTFINEADERRTTEKYRRNPFYLDKPRLVAI